MPNIDRIKDSSGNQWSSGKGTTIKDTGKTYTVTDRNGDVTAELSKSSIVEKKTSATNGEIVGGMLVMGLLGLPGS